jgi:hypothetical protein
MSFLLRNKPLRLPEMLSLNNFQRKKLEEELSMSSLRTSETNCKFKNKKREPDKLSVKTLRRRSDKSKSSKPPRTINSN